MKFKQLLQLLLLFVAGQVLFACGSAKYYDFGSGHNSSAYHKEKKAALETEAAMAENAHATAEKTNPEQVNLTAAPALEASAGAAIPEIPAPILYRQEAGPTSQVATAGAIGNQSAEKSISIKKQTKAEKKKNKSGLFAGIKAVKATLLEVIFAILLPPVAVALHEGITTRFWISILLTLLFWLPGIIYAFLIITDTI